MTVGGRAERTFGRAAAEAPRGAGRSSCRCCGGVPDRNGEALPVQRHVGQPRVLLGENGGEVDDHAPGVPEANNYFIVLKL